MEIILRLASSVDDVLDLILGEGLPSPVEKTMGQYPYVFPY